MTMIGMTMRTSAVWGILLIIGLVHPIHAKAQVTDPIWEVGLAATGNLLVGAASDFLDGGFGLLGFGGRRVGESVWFRGDVLYFRLDSDEAASESADNAILSFGFGPELVLGGSSVRGYVRGVIGLVANLQSRSNSSLGAESSWAGMFGGGVGVRFRLGSSARAPALDLGGDVLRTGNLDFVRTELLQGVVRENVAILSLRAGLTVPVH